MAATSVDICVFSCPSAASFTVRRFLSDLNLTKPIREKTPTTIRSSRTTSAIVPAVQCHRFDVDAAAEDAVVVDTVELIVADAVVEVAKAVVISFELDVVAAAGSSFAYKCWYSAACRPVRPSVGIATTLVAARAIVM